MYDEYKVDLPIGKSNNWSIEHFEVCGVLISED